MAGRFLECKSTDKRPFRVKILTGLHSMLGPLGTLDWWL